MTSGVHAVAGFPIETAVRKKKAALTHIMHQVLISTSILANWLEAFQWQWNAAMTLVGIVLAIPHDDSTGAARSTIDLSVAVLESFGNSFAVTAGAPSILGKLCAKVDVLIENGQGKKAVWLEKTQVVTNYQEVGEQSPMDGNPAALPSIDDPMGFFNVTAAEFRGLSAQSIEIMATEMYDDVDLSGMDDGYLNR